MAISLAPKVLYSGGQLTTAATILYTAPNTTSITIITEVVFTNVDVSARTFSVYIVRSGDMPTDANILMKNFSMDVNRAYVSPELAGQMLAAGDTIQALASANTAITCSGISGFE